MKAGLDTRWDEVLRIIGHNVTTQQFNTWFKPIAMESFNETTKTVLLQVPSQFVYEYLEENYVGLLNSTLSRVFGKGVRLQYRITIDKEHGITSTEEGDATPRRRETEGKRAGINQPPSVLDAAEPQDIDPQLNPRQTFENFIEGDSNKLPRSVGMAIADHPGKNQFNPLFIFGPSGCGKTHLINAIGLRAKRLYPAKRVLYISARLFQVQFTNATLHNKVNDFILFYQTIDMLIVDDIQEWMTSPKTLETFFHIFNHLFRNNKCIILASDRPPVDLEGMEKRITTRFACGLIAELEKPNYQLCVDILRSKIRHDGLKISDEVVKYIAETANGSVRDLQGVVNSLMAYSIVDNSDINLKLARRVVKRAVNVEDKPVTVDDIMDNVCRHFNVTPAAVNSKSRKRELVVARQVSMYLSQKYTKMTASRIGKLVGGRDHSTVLHSCAQVELRLKADKKFHEEMAEIERTFNVKA